MKNELSILVNTCKSYEDVLKIFFIAFDKYWKNCPYKVYINTEAENNKIDDWGFRLISSLDEIDSQYVLMLYDDFILEDYVSDKKIEDLINIIKCDKNIAAIYLINTMLTGKEFCDANKLNLIKDNVEYKLNSTPGIWNKDVLLKYTKPGDTPWAWEVFGTYRTRNERELFLTINDSENDVYRYNYKQGGAIYRGKWVRDVIDKIELDLNYSINWDERGIASSKIYEKRNIRWKYNFLKLGWKMVGLKSLYYLKHYIEVKFRGQF